MTARVRLILGIVGCAILILLFALVRGTRAPSGVIDGRAETAQASPATPSSAALSGGEAAGAPARVAGSATAAGVPGRDAPVAGGARPAPDVATLVVEVVRWRDGTPVSGVEVTVRGAEHVTDPEGIVVVEVPASSALFVLAWPEDRSLELGMGRASVAPLDRGERGTVRIELPENRRGEFWGRVIDAATGDPVTGARIGEGFPDETLTSDASGLFRVDTFSLHPSTLIVEADGWGPAVAVTEPGHERAEDALPIELLRSASLHAVLRGAPTGVSEVYLSAAFPDLVRAGDARHVARFEHHGPEGRNWKRTLIDGACTFEDLPARVPLSVILHRPGAYLPIGETLVLEPGEERRVEWSFASTIEGRVLDQEGAPVSGAEVWCVEESRAVLAPERHSIRHVDRNDVRSTATTDDGGAFVLRDVQPGRWWVGIGPKAPRRMRSPLGSSTWPEENDVASDATLVLVDDVGVYACDLRAWRGFEIRGRVALPDGRPARLAGVSATRTDGMFRVEVMTSSSGAFTVGPLSPGTYRLVADGVHEHVSSSAVEAEVGARDVRLAVRAGGRIVGRVRGAPSGTARVAYTLAPASGRATPRAVTGETALAADGSFTLGPVEPGVYGLSILAPGPTVGTARGIDVVDGGLAPDVAVELAPGGTLRVLCEGVEPWARLSMDRDGVVLASDRVRQGTEVSRHVPAGDVRVVLTDEAGRSVERTLRVAAGATELVELTLE